MYVGDYVHVCVWGEWLGSPVRAHQGIWAAFSACGNQSPPPAILSCIWCRRDSEHYLSAPEMLMCFILRSRVDHDQRKEAIAKTTEEWDGARCGEGEGAAMYKSYLLQVWVVCGHRLKGGDDSMLTLTSSLCAVDITWWIMWYTDMLKNQRDSSLAIPICVSITTCLHTLLKKCCHSNADGAVWWNVPKYISFLLSFF